MQITLKNLSCGYESVIVKNIELDFTSGKWHFLIGTTGSGKSTLLQTLTGIIPKKSGEILLNSCSLDKKEVLREFRDKLGIMFQYTEKQFFNHNVKEEIIFTLKRKKVSAEVIEKKLNEVMELLSIPSELLERSPFELSGGQKRTIALASLLINEPQILILDEPTVGLDTETKEVFLSTLKKLNDKGVTILQSAHIMEDVAEYGHSVTVLSNGSLITHGTPEEVILSREVLSQAGLEPPEILEFYEIFEEMGLKLPISSKTQDMIEALLEAGNE